MALFKRKTEIPDDGKSSGGVAKRGDRRMNYGTKADKYNDDKYGADRVVRRADTKKPPT